MQPHFGKLFTNSSERSDVIVVRVRDENMTQHKLVFFNGFQNLLSIPAGIKQRSFTRNFVPDEITIHRDVLSRGTKRMQFAPGAEIPFRRSPAIGNSFELSGGQSYQTCESHKIRAFPDLTGLLQSTKFCRRYTCSIG